DAVIDDARAAREIAVLRGIADELVHLGQPALMQQVDDELQLMETFVVGHLGLIAGLDERLEALHDELGRATAQYCLLSEEIRFGLLGEGGFEHATAGAADPVRVSKRLRMRFAGRVFRDSDEAGDAPAFLILTPYQTARTFRGDQ